MTLVMSTTSSLDGNYSPPSPNSLWVHDGESTSSIYPDRPIRPLPKRRLRSRLSPESFRFILQSQKLGQIPIEDKQQCDFEGYSTGHDTHSSYGDSKEVDDSYQFKGLQVPADAYAKGMDSPIRSPCWRKAGFLSPTTARNGSSESRREIPRFSKASMPLSAASSVISADGYDSFENTNNKKKRKIPISGSLGSHQSSLSADLAHMDLSSVREYERSHADSDKEVGEYDGSGNPAPDIIPHSAISSCVGRGNPSRASCRRYSGRSPLRLLANGTNASHIGRRVDVAGSNSGGLSGFPRPSNNRGVIAAAVANTNNVAIMPDQGKENSPDIVHPLPRKSDSAKTQFTFTCGSGAAKSTVWPGYTFPSIRGARGGVTSRSTNDNALAHHEGVSTQGTQATHQTGEQSLRSQPNVSLDSQPPQLASKPRRSLTKQLALAARERRLQQDYDNYNSPLKEDKIWVCEFCEYESIFGHPPEALVRQYEIKDRRERRRLAEKRRLLEKAKMKSRKGKKGSKKGHSSVTAQPQYRQDQKQQYEISNQDTSAIDSQCTQSDEYTLDDYDNDPVPVKEKAQPQTKPRISQDANKIQSHSL